MIPPKRLRDNRTHPYTRPESLADLHFLTLAASLRRPERRRNRARRDVFRLPRTAVIARSVSDEAIQVGS